MPIVRGVHDETMAKLRHATTNRMDLIQLQKYSDRAGFPVHSRRPDKIEGVCIYTIRTVTYTRAQCARIHARISVHGLINWITLTRRPPGTREHPALRKETGHSKRLSSSIRFPSISLPPLLFVSALFLLLLLLTRSCFFRRRQDTEETDGRESRSPLSVPRAPTISTRHSSHVSNVQVKHRVLPRDTRRYHRYP